MVKNPPEGVPRVSPYLYYDDLPAALAWLEKAFGFETRFTLPGPDGTIVHAEVAVQDSLIMLGPTGMVPTLVSPRSTEGRNTQTTFAYVDDVDAHCERARAAGAVIVREPEDEFWGDRMYIAQDLEGHGWSFGQHIRDVPPEEMKMPGT